MKRSLFLLLPLLLLIGGPVAAQDIAAVTWSGDTVAIKSTTGTGRVVGPTGWSGLNSLAKDPGGRLYAMAGGTLITVMPGTGRGKFLASTSLASVRGMAIHPGSGECFLFENGGGPTGLDDPDLLYRLDLVTGLATFVGQANAIGIQGLAFSPHGVLYAWDTGRGGGTGQGLITVDQATGATTDVDPLENGPGNAIQCLAFSAAGHLYGASEDLYLIDPASGAAVQIGGKGWSNVRGLEFTGGQGCTFTLTPPDPGIAGRPNTVTFSCATPLAAVVLAYGFQAGSTAVAKCPGLGVDIHNAGLAGVIQADASGKGSATRFVPRNLAGRSLLLQAVDLRACEVSNLVSRDFF